MNDQFPRPLLESARALLFAGLFLLPTSGAFGVEVIEETVEQEYAVEPEATLSIQNTDGAIRVYASDVREISIQTIKRAYTSERLKQIVVSVKATSQNVTIETIFPPRKNGLSLSDRSGTVEYTVIVPFNTRVTKLDLVNGEVLVDGLHGGSATAHLVNGWLAAHNCFGDLNFRLENGRLDAVYDWWEGRRFSAKLISERGNVRALLPSDVPIGIVARAGTGRIANTLDSNRKEPSEPIHALDFSTGADPEVIFELTSTTGNIRIDKSY
ncbi:MAG: hypothetical protein M3N12_01885 [Verrucomicrobiota bacterium]|nr:hypothetical protein [Verrucomicrobiota bacterium]